MEHEDYEEDESREEWSESLRETIPRYIKELEMELQLEKEMGWVPSLKEEYKKPEMTIPILTDELMEKDDFHPFVRVSKKELSNIYTKFFDKDKMSFGDFTQMVLLGTLPKEWNL
jgi:hypothetical protein